MDFPISWKPEFGGQHEGLQRLSPGGSVISVGVGLTVVASLVPSAPLCAWRVSAGGFGGLKGLEFVLEEMRLPQERQNPPEGLMPGVFLNQKQDLSSLPFSSPSPLSSFHYLPCSLSLACSLLSRLSGGAEYKSS